MPVNWLNIYYLKKVAEVKRNGGINHIFNIQETGAYKLFDKSRCKHLKNYEINGLIPAIEQVGENKCTGCYACYSSCPTKAITMRLSDDGFLFPSVNSDRCIKCGLCQKYCPIINFPAKKQSPIQAVAAFSNHEKTRLESSSGGIFSELARYFIKNNGVVFGAAFDKDFNLVHTCADKEDQLFALTGSKYIQSHINDAYISAINAAKQNRPVLFCGTPCQVAALNNLFHEKGVNTNKLCLCDVICHGVASESVFKKYLAFLSIDKKSSISQFRFRNKRLGWENFGSYAIYNDNSEYFEMHRNDVFMIGYLKNLFLRESCYACQFARIPRQSDITMGDFWGINKKLYDARGVSAIIINTANGKQVFEKLDITKYPVELDTVTPFNLRLINGTMKVPTERNNFFSDLRVVDFQIIGCVF